MSGSPLNDIISVMIDHMNISKMEVATWELLVVGDLV